MKTATYIKKWNGRRDGDAGFYELSEPIADEYGNLQKVVLVSAVPHVGSHGPAETYIFPANENLDGPSSFLEMDGSFKGSMDHAKALRNLGYELVGAL